jgi:hypothetical protein
MPQLRRPTFCSNRPPAVFLATSLHCRLSRLPGKGRRDAGRRSRDRAWLRSGRGQARLGAATDEGRPAQALGILARLRDADAAPSLSII